MWSLCSSYGSHGLDSSPGWGQRVHLMDRTVWILALAGGIVLCSWGRRLLSECLLPPWSINGYSKNLMLGVTLESHPGGSRNTPSESGDKHSPNGPLGSYADLFYLTWYSKMILVFDWLNKARYSGLLKSLKAPLSREQEAKAPSISRNTTCRKTFGWWTPEDFLTATKRS